MEARTSRDADADAVARGAQAIQRRPVASLIRYAKKRPHAHLQALVGKIAGPIREFSFKNLVLVD